MPDYYQRYEALEKKFKILTNWKRLVIIDKLNEAGAKGLKYSDLKHKVENVGSEKIGNEFEYHLQELRKQNLILRTVINGFRVYKLTSDGVELYTLIKALERDIEQTRDVLSGLEFHDYLELPKEISFVELEDAIERDEAFSPLQTFGEKTKFRWLVKRRISDPKAEKLDVTIQLVSDEEMINNRINITVYLPVERGVQESSTGAIKKLMSEKKEKRTQSLFVTTVLFLLNDIRRIVREIEPENINLITEKINELILNPEENITQKIAPI